MHTLNMIIKEMEEQKKNQKELCDFLNIKNQAFSDWKSGKSKSYLKYLPQISEFLNVPIDYLIGKTDKKENTLAHQNESNSESSEQEQILLNYFRSTTEEGKMRIIQCVMNIYDEIEKKNTKKN